MNLIEKVEERLSIFKNLYDNIRIVDPINKKTILIKSNKDEETYADCYSLWEKHTFCENCISMSAFNNNDTFVKIEYDREKVTLITATPIEIDGNIFIAEILKDITKNGSVLQKVTEESRFVEEFVNSMNEKAVKCELTGIYNRKYINERLPIDLNYSRINNLPLSIIMTEIDFLKNINDEYGQSIKNRALIDFSNIIMKSIRSNTDWVGRYSKGKFIIVLNDTSLKNTYIVAEKIRKQVENFTFYYDNININLTSSFGVYSVTDYNIHFSELLSKVDKNLYKAKMNGNNRTIVNQERVIEAVSTKSGRNNIKLERLNKQITEMREDLNEICCTLDDDETKSKRLTVSQHLDELIVEFMREMNNLKL